MSWDFSSFNRRVRRDALRHRATFFSSFDKVLRERTPVDTGALQASWKQEGPKDNFGTVKVISRLPYAARIEFGHSKQAPNGMLRRTAVDYGIPPELKFRG